MKKEEKKEDGEEKKRGGELENRTHDLPHDNSPAAIRHNLASAPIVGFLVEYAYYDHPYEGKVYWTSVSIEQF